MGRMTKSYHASGGDTVAGADARRRIIWIGSAAGLELGIAHAGLAMDADLTDAESPQKAAAAYAALAGSRKSGRVGGIGSAGGIGFGVAAETTPVLGVLAADRPGRFTTADALLLSRVWPLMPIVSVASSLVDGRRRSGPQIPGIEEVPWHDLPGRCRWWLAALAAGLPTSLGLPATARREERLLESITGIRSRGPALPPGAAGPVEVSVAAERADDLESLCDLLARTGHRIIGRHLGRPHLDESAAAVIWDVGDLSAGDTEWLRLLAANRPGLCIVVLESFPRGDTVMAALRAGAAAVLGRPLSLEALLGTLLGWQPEKPGHAGLGRPGVCG
jgi:hypothetical protein